MSHPTNRQVIKSGKQIISQTVKSEPDNYPDIEACQLCGEPMELLSIELGYSCSNDDCLLHFHRARALLCKMLYFPFPPEARNRAFGGRNEYR